MSWELHNNINAFGDVCELNNITCNAKQVMKELEQFKDNWKKFNSGKPWILRDGLSVTSLHGELWKPWLARCHFLRLPQGGHFPPHLDGGREIVPDVFRIIVPIQNCVPPDFFMMIKSGANFESIPFKYGISTFVNTTKRHVLFNANSKDSIMLIMNIKLTKESFSKYRFEVY